MTRTKKRLIIYFDGWCPLCQKSSRLLKKLDIFRRLEHASFREPEVLKNLSIPYEDLERRLHVYDRTNQRFSAGIHGVLCICRAVIPLWPLVPILLLCVWLGFGEKVYDYIASRRTLIPTGCTDACQIQHPKQKMHDAQKK